MWHFASLQHFWHFHVSCQHGLSVARCVLAAKLRHKVARIGCSGIATTCRTIHFGVCDPTFPLMGDGQHSSCPLSGQEGRSAAET